MFENSYLYGEDVEVMEFPRHLILDRIEKLSFHLEDLMKLHYTERTSATDKQIKDICKAIKFFEEIGEM